MPKNIANKNDGQRTRSSLPSGSYSGDFKVDIIEITNSKLIYKTLIYSSVSFSFY